MDKCPLCGASMVVTFGEQSWPHRDAVVWHRPGGWVCQLRQAWWKGRRLPQGIIFYPKEPSDD